MMSDQQIPIFPPVPEDIPQIVSILTKNEKVQDPSVPPMMKSTNLIEEGNRSLRTPPLFDGSMSTVSDSATSSAALINEVPQTQPLPPPAPPAEDDLNDFFDDDFFRFMSDDDLAMASSSQATIATATGAATQTHELRSTTCTQTTTTNHVRAASSVSLLMVSMEDENRAKAITTTSQSVNQQTASSGYASSNSTDEDNMNTKKEEEASSSISEANKRKRKNLTAEQKANGRRERNREHAKRSRKRKKVFVETLQEMIVQLKAENEKMRSCMTQHFGSNFVQDLLSSKAARQVSVSPSIHSLPTPSHHTGGSFEAICPKLVTPPQQPSSSSSSSIVQNMNESNLRPQASLHPMSTMSDPNNHATNTINNTTMSCQDLISPSSHTTWLMEENIPKHLRRKNLMYKDKLSVLLPRQSPVSSSSFMPAIQQQYLPDKQSSTTSSEDDLLSMDTLTLPNVVDCPTTAGNLVANPILSQTK